MNLRTQCLTQNDAVIKTIDTNSIISYKLSSYQILGDSLFQYNVSPYQFNVLYSELKGTPILDSLNCPIALDEHNILNKYMVYYIDDTISKKQALYILQDSIKYSDQTNEFKFQAVPMIGVLSKYDTVKPTTVIAGQVYNVPRDIKFTSSYTGSGYQYYSPVWTNISNTIGAKLGRIYGTSVANIITNNGQYPADLWHSTDGLKQYWIDGSKDKNCMQLDDIGYDTVFPSSNIYVHMLQNQTFLSWDDTIKNYLNINDVDIDTYLNSYTHRFNIPYNYNGTSARIQYGERIGIDYIPDPNGLTFTQLITKLTNYGIFNYDSGSAPYILTSSIDPGDIIDGQHVIGIYPDRPTWLTGSNPYYYRNPINDSVKRMFKLQLYKYGVLYSNIRIANNIYTFDVNGIRRRLSYQLNIEQPNAIGQLWDLGYATINLSNRMNEGSLYNQIVNWTIFPQGYTGSIRTSDDFIKYYYDTSQDSINTYTTVTSGSNSFILQVVPDPAIPNGRLSDFISINSPLILDTFRFKQDQELNTINILKQFMLYQNMTILQKDGGLTYDSALKCGYTRRIYNDNINTIPLSQFYNMDSGLIWYVQSYSFVPILPFKFGDISQKYSQIILTDFFKSSINQYYQKLRKSYKYRISITLIGISHGTTINITDSRYFIFKGLRWICTSYTVDTNTNTTTIQGYGG